MKWALLLCIPCAMIAQEAIAPSPQSQNHCKLSIEAKARSEDILRAYDLLKKEKPTLKISARTYSGQTLNNIVDMTAMPNGTLLLFRISSTQGVKNQFVSVDDLLDLFYTP